MRLKKQGFPATSYIYLTTGKIRRLPLKQPANRSKKQLPAHLPHPRIRLWPTSPIPLRKKRPFFAFLLEFPHVTRLTMQKQAYPHNSDKEINQ
jgi:hypothetical protein